MNDIKRELKKAIKNQKIVIAVSGGPDSMCLLDLVLKSKENTTIIVAHVNHKLRKESDDEAKMVEDICKKNNIIYECTSIDFYKGNTENYAREKRYTFFKKLIKKYNAKYLLTAHHGDDLMETIIMRLIDGKNISELTGFSKITKYDSYIIYRPLISITKEEILSYCKNNNITFCTDQSNFKDEYKRNRIRKYIIPQFKKENKNVHKNFLKFSESLKNLEEELTNQIPDLNEIDIDYFNTNSKIIKQKIIYNLLKQTYKEDIKQIKEKHIENIIKLLSNTKPNLTIDLPLNYEFTKSYTKAKINKKSNAKPYDIILKDEINLPNKHIIKLIKTSKDNSNNEIKINSKDITLPIHVRTKKAGDKIEVKGLNGIKKVKDIFIDEKIPKEERTIFPIITDDKGVILWLPGIKKSKFDVSNNKNYDIIIRYF